MAKKKVAILGGGTGAMTAAYYLSNTQQLRDELDVTVYQMGWRLGGKGASGRRGGDFHDRIEEHGLHVWGGFYYNAFRMMNDCYKTLSRPPECPINSCFGATGAFEPHDVVAWGEDLPTGWVTWLLNVPFTPDQWPGQGTPHPTLWQSILRVLGWIKDALKNWPHDAVQAQVNAPGATSHPDLREPFFAALRADLVAGLHLAEGSVISLFEAAERIAAELDGQAGAANVANRNALLSLLRGLHNWLHSEILTKLDELGNLSRRIFIVVDIGMAMLIGLVADFLMMGGFKRLDQLDFAAWLRCNGAAKIAVDSAPLRGYYDYFFAYENGDSSKPSMSAGMGANHLIRLIGDYLGHLFWKMRSGMGDAVFAPLYQLCVANGVKFKFFHRVDSIVPDDGGTRIDRVVLNRQVDLTVPDYQPFVFPKNLPSWPSDPLWDQIDPAQAGKLRAANINLEDPIACWPDVGTIELQAGKDFDAVVLGISIGALGSICKPLMAQKADWRNMIANLPAIQTQALQLWWKPTVAELGWEHGNATGTAYAPPLQSYSDMTLGLPQEDWPAGEEPGAVVYFCGPMPTMPIPDQCSDDYGQVETAKAWASGLTWAKENLRLTYPNLYDADGQLRWDDFIDPTGGTGEKRFAAQYARANYTPSERYVIDLPKTNQYRLEAATSGYTNLALAGDWLFTGLGGAIEAAVIAGMQAARGLVTRITDEIVGETATPWPRPVTLEPLIK